MEDLDGVWSSGGILGIPRFTIEYGFWGVTDVASLLLGNFAQQSVSFLSLCILLNKLMHLLLRVD